MTTNDREGPRQSLGQWLIENGPCLAELKVPSRHEDRERAVPFADWAQDEWEALDRLHPRSADE
jgi:hypothetical protein